MQARRTKPTSNGDEGFPNKLSRLMVLPAILRYNLFSFVLERLKFTSQDPDAGVHFVIVGEPKIDFRSKSICALNL